MVVLNAGWIIFTIFIICYKICLKKRKIKGKEAGDGPFKNVQVQNCIFRRLGAQDKKVARTQTVISFIFVVWLTNYTKTQEI